MYLAKIKNGKFEHFINNNWQLELARKSSGKSIIGYINFKNEYNAARLLNDDLTQAFNIEDGYHVVNLITNKLGVGAFGDKYACIKSVMIINDEVFNTRFEPHSGYEWGSNT